MKVMLATNSRDRGSTSRTLESWLRIFPDLGVTPSVSIGGSGPLLDALTALGVPVSIRSLNRYPDRRWPVPFLLAAASLYRSLRASGAEILHLNEHEFQRIAAVAARWAKIPLVTHVRFRLTQPYADWLFRRPYTPARVFFASDAAMQDSATAIEPTVPSDRWRLVPNGLDFSTYGCAIESRDRLRDEWGVFPGTVVFGMACAVSAIKRVDHFVDLIARLREQHADVYGVIAGAPHSARDQPLFEGLCQRVRDLGLERFVRFLGYVEPLEPVYRAWDICVSTSAYETFGMSVLEGMASGCAVLAYAVGAIPEVVGNGGVLVPDEDREALVTSALQLIADPHRREAVAAAGRLRAREFDVRRSAQLLLKEYGAVITEAHALPGGHAEANGAVASRELERR